ncbi:MAG: 2-hydroxy-3-keto-5-methylthiopentenyl-1-phosphate phosphatase [candidate division WS2 bacterium ADurb.Bin280]|uniref:2-hydroxy-3-keto-5-methylthiopentenyl-1-phosphate phosphatase n=1 Tax=candidate division WS2 bacterium ADurb.Bin280 TaxID=1852829 RepID=A0A1V5SF54_9BACT|nr:MAG: 2-hydroxy-3-keto-5-methylthiopentenyl-1-phosphate phosphatase [candidate division WS2 bacterium ADurb.Bin280]
METVVYIDFDGTISTTDVLNHLLEAFTGNQWLPIDEKYLAGEISSKECISKQVSLMSKATNREILEKAEEVGLDPYFKDFIKYCIKKEYKFKILSDGLDIYINHLLKAEGIEGVEVMSNKFIGSGIVKFPYHYKLCKKNCGNCKKGHIECSKFTVYIGDGASDYCAAKECNLVFAKNSLSKHLKNNNIKHIQFNNFKDITAYFEGLDVD